jgi:hypothetical protein
MQMELLSAFLAVVALKMAERSSSVVENHLARQVVLLSCSAVPLVPLQAEASHFLLQMASTLDLWWPNLVHLKLVLLVALRCDLENPMLRVARLKLLPEMVGLWQALFLCLLAAVLMRPARLAASQHVPDLFRSFPLVVQP